jgi:hypothetical protein
MDEEKIKYVLENTKILRLPKRKIATFGSTNVKYYLITELLENVVEIREGRVTAERPRIISPPDSGYRNLEGFEEYQSSQAFLAFFRKYMRGLHYGFKFRNETEKINSVYNPLKKVVNKIFEIVDKGGGSTGVVKGVDIDTWAISLAKFLKKTVESSVDTNVTELEERGFFEQAGYERLKFKTYKEVPYNLRHKAKELFEKTKRGKLKIMQLQAELINLGIYHIYVEQFLELYRSLHR